MAIFCPECYDSSGLKTDVLLPAADWASGARPKCTGCGELVGSTVFYNVPEGCLLVWDDELLYRCNRYGGDRDVEFGYDKELWECKYCDAVFAHRDITRRYGGTPRKPDDEPRNGFILCGCPECGKDFYMERVKAPEGCLAVTEGEIL